MLLVDGKILFVHMKKCGGTAFCKGLIDVLPPDRVFYLGYDADGEARSTASRRAGKIWKHSFAKEIRDELDPDGTEFKKVYLLANRPFWERVASFYLHCRRHNARSADKYPWVKGMSFKEYLRSDHAEFEQITDYALDDNGQNMVDVIVDFDQISETYKVACKEFGFSNQSMPILNANPIKVDYRSFYDLEDWNLVVSKYRGEIDFLNEQEHSVDVDWIDTSDVGYSPSELPRIFEAPVGREPRTSLSAIGITAPHLRAHFQSSFEVPVRVSGSIRPANPVHIGAFTVIDKAILSNCKIGRYCTIEARAMIGYIGNSGNRLTTSAAAFRPLSAEWRRFLTFSDRPLSTPPQTVIGNDVSVGRNAVICAGVTVGDGAIIAPNSYVDADVPPFAIVAGAPADVVSYRFETNQENPEKFRARLKGSEWWNYALADIGRIVFEEKFSIASLEKTLGQAKPFVSRVFRAWELGSVLTGVIPPYLEDVLRPPDP
ncbi:hypothetical protein PXK00_16815 [Phaeobacter sp. QD34_3]|uniref:hypothetical protein n=1 Tax=unclassified Phaeobacter TaxID=2621772 RepID=UPI00237F7926|nr:MULTISPECIES: hypothetical protein [unclassified Phaeobacter]MDE4134782.1 hypothetical protein [Phaeobacter sp. QD34_3]MDE4138440.1 hypothetical protein [Phaeobacter sp. QD34_24]